MPNPFNQSDHEDAARDRITFRNGAQIAVEKSGDPIRGSTALQVGRAIPLKIRQGPAQAFQLLSDSQLKRLIERGEVRLRRDQVKQLSRDPMDDGYEGDHLP